MNKIKHALYLFRSLGFIQSIKFAATLPVRFFNRYFESSLRIKTTIRSHQRIWDTVNSSIIKNLTPLSAGIKKEAYLLYSKFNLKPNLLWHQLFITLNKKHSAAYISEDLLYNYIEPHLNQESVVSAFADKNNYNRFFPAIKQPRTIIRYVNGSYFTSDYAYISQTEASQLISDEPNPVLFKPSKESGQGRNIFKLFVKDSVLWVDKRQIESITDLNQIAPKGFIVQEIISQHKEIEDIYPFSVNTVRLITLRLHGEIIVLNTILKIGNNSHYLDKMAFGGLCCGINKNGELYPFAYDNSFNLHSTHPQTGAVFKEKKIPGYERLKQEVIEAHRTLTHLNMISWDFAIGKDEEPILIEMNLQAQGIMYQQAIFGPLFGNYTNDVIELVTR